jgi:hypothetical protein
MGRKKFLEHAVHQFAKAGAVAVFGHLLHAPQAESLRKEGFFSGR